MTRNNVIGLHSHIHGMIHKSQDLGSQGCELATGPPLCSRAPCSSAVPATRTTRAKVVALRSSPLNMMLLFLEYISKDSTAFSRLSIVSSFRWFSFSSSTTLPLSCWLSLWISERPFSSLCLDDLISSKLSHRKRSDVFISAMSLRMALA